MKIRMKLYFALLSAVPLLVSCDRIDPEIPEGEDFSQQDMDVIVADPITDEGFDHQVNTEQGTIVETPEPEVIVEQPEVPPPPAPVPPPPPPAEPQLVVKSYSTYRINISEMKQSCPGNTVNIEQLRLKYGTEFLVDNFVDYPNSSDPKYNAGTIGGYEVQLTTSGDYDKFYPFEAFGGGFGAGWWSSANTFNTQTPASSVSAVYFDINFMNTKIALNGIYLNGGTNSLTPEFQPCAPSSFTIMGTDDGIDWDILADVANLDTQEGVEITLDLPLVELAVSTGN